MKASAVGGIRVAGADIGTKNFGLCLVDLLHVDSTLAVETDSAGRRHVSRRPIPRFLILNLELLDLTSPTETLLPANGGDAGVARLHEHLVGDAQRESGLASVRTNLVRRIAQWPLLHEAFRSTVTSRVELPAVVTENQLDVTGEDPRERGRKQHLWALRRDLTAAGDAGAAAGNSLVAKEVLGLFARGELDYKRRDDFVRGRMYTLANVFSATVEAVDESRKTPQRRLVLASAKKYDIPSDSSLTYAERKRRSVELFYTLLREQVDADSSTDEERANGRRWIAFLDARADEGHKLDDLADAFLLALDVALRIHKKWYKKGGTLAPMPECYAPVTPTDRATALGRPPPAAAVKRAKKRAAATEAEEKTEKKKARKTKK